MRGFMGGSSKPPAQTDEQRKLEEKNAELMELQLAQAKQPLPKIPKLKPLPPPPPPATATSADALAAQEEQRRQAGRRTNTARNTLFAGETGGYRRGALGGAATLLG
jgi:hypothetical protein